jgi:hypothetical protein
MRLATSPFYNVTIADWFGRPSEQTLRLALSALLGLWESGKESARAYA